MMRSCGSTSLRVGCLHFQEKLLVEHHRERTEVAVVLQLANGVGYRVNEASPRVGAGRKRPDYGLRSADDPRGASSPSHASPPRISQICGRPVTPGGGVTIGGRGRRLRTIP